MRDTTLFKVADGGITGAAEASFDLGNCGMCAVQAVWDVNTPAAAAFAADDETDVCTAEAHGMATGLKVRVSTDGVLPTGLAAATDYFVIAVDEDTFQLATSRANALAGTEIDLEDAGTGTHTITPTALAGGTIKLQKTVDGTNWVDVHDDEVTGGANSQNVTADGGNVWVIPDAMWRQVKLVLAMTAGQLTLAASVVAKRK